MALRKLYRGPVDPHPWRFHRWELVDGLVYPLGLVYQCDRCNLVKVVFPITEEERIVTPDKVEQVGDAQ